MTTGEGDLADLLQQPRFGRQLRAFRLERGLSQAEVADAQISTAYLSRLESGARQPTVKVFEYLLERLGLTAAAFRPAGRDQLSTLLATVVSSDPSTVDAAELARSLQQARSADPATRWQALWLLSRAQDQAAQREDELVTLRELVALSEGLDAPELRVRSLNQLARCLRATGDLVSAQEAAAASFAAAQQLPVAEQARPLMTLVSTEAEMGRIPDALAHAAELEELVAGARGTLAVEALWAAAAVRIRAGGSAEAVRLMEQALRQLDSQDHLLLWLRLRLAAASLYLQTNPSDPARAEHWLAEAEPALRLVGQVLQRAEFGMLRAIAAFQRDDLAGAEQACADLEGIEHHLTFRDLLRVRILRNRILLRRGRTAEAVDGLRELATAAQHAAIADLTAEIWQTIAEALMSRPSPP